ncbi:maltodextrin glucosidase [Deinococcus misasensis]|uniref:maltodextrin glucosidase n=1 Tax=Deinococcus misasensis TaxID=392413 RepID=UPI0006921B46|nr:maltodextrin glucosidase [Deinococcus misasensis]
MTYHHDGTPFFLKREGEHMRVFLEAPPEMEGGWAVSYAYGDEQLLPLEKAPDGRWTGLVYIQKHQKTHYRFKVLERGKLWWFNQAGLSRSSPASGQDFSFTPVAPPVWVRERVFYQIFPERFKNGDPSISVQEGEYFYEGRDVMAKSWDDLPGRHTGHQEFYGGDLEGIRQSIPYFQKLGVNALYLNPVFESPSSHKYDTQDYLKIDPHFGTNAGFAALVEELHQNDIKIILDGVFNHTGDRHPWMNKTGLYPEAGAYQNGPTRDFYTYTGPEPEDYLGWVGVKTLPKLDYANPQVRDAIYRSPDSVVRFWLKEPYQIDGWRLDVAPMIGMNGSDEGNKDILKELYTAARETHPDAYIFGEHFYDAVQWLQGGTEDATMNYHSFTWPTWAFLGGLDHRGVPAHEDAEDWAEAILRNLWQLPFSFQLAQFNLLDSHDTQRFATVCPDPERQKIAAAMLLTFIGVPCIYYGDEIGMEGTYDPDCRRTMPWDHPERWEHPLYEWYRDLIRLRHQEKALQEGSFRIVLAQKDHLVYERRLGEERIQVVLTRHAPLEYTLSGHWTDLLSGEILESLHLPSAGVRIIKEKR